jgi:hypothetical protein
MSISFRNARKEASSYYTNSQFVLFEKFKSKGMEMAGTFNKNERNKKCTENSE